ncbi:hypothetical protein MCC01941_17570 [Bifidobacteriaceae bacterium MCC01941]|nr:hypothetical protein MCC01941_17570 [Bifidobacteriaceae bacterium MCC01941]
MRDRPAPYTGIAPGNGWECRMLQLDACPSGKESIGIGWGRVLSA